MSPFGSVAPKLDPFTITVPFAVDEETIVVATFAFDKTGASGQVALSYESVMVGRPKTAVPW